MRVVQKNDIHCAALFTDEELWFEVYICARGIEWRSTRCRSEIDFSADLSTGWMIQGTTNLMEKNSGTLGMMQAIYRAILNNPKLAFMESRL